MDIVKLKEYQSDQFNKYVQTHPRGFFLQAWDWGLWQTALGKTVERYQFLDGGKPIGSAQIILMDTPAGSYAYCPLGPLWDESIDTATTLDLLKLLAEELQSEHKLLFVRVEPPIQIDISVIATKSETVQPPQTLLKDISGSDDELLATFHHKTRYNIKVAQRRGVTVKTFAEPHGQVIDLIMQTTSRQGYRNHPAGYIKKMWQFFADNTSSISATGYLATLDNIPIASGLMIDFSKMRMYLFGGSDYKHRSAMAPYLIHWRAMLDAKSRGINYYDFGAAENASGHTGGYMRFKMGFNPEIINFTGTHDIVLNRPRYALFKTLRRANRAWLHLPFNK